MTILENSPAIAPIDLSPVVELVNSQPGGVSAAVHYLADSLMTWPAAVVGVILLGKYNKYRKAKKAAALAPPVVNPVPL